MFYTIICLSGLFQDTNRIAKPSLLGIVQKRKYFYFEKFYTQVHHILHSPKITDVIIILKNDFNPVYFTALQEMKVLLEKLTRSGRQVYFISTDYTYKAIYLGSVCTKRYIHKLGTCSFFGFSLSRLYLKKIIEKYNVFIEVYRRDVYKDGFSEFTMDSMDDYLKEEYTELLDATNDEFLKTVKANLHKNDDELGEFVKGKILFSEEAVQSKWVDAIGTEDDVIDEIKDKKPFLKEYNCRDTLKHFKKGKKKIALLFLEGLIDEGKSGVDLFAGKKAGTDSFIPVIQEIASDQSIHGVILRINSPGGSGIASCDFARELEKLQKKKPVIASIGNIGASGSYWAASPCKKIFANTTSWVGSIGVVYIIIALHEFIKKHQINFASLKTGEYADLYSIFEKRTETSKKMIQIQIDNLYKKFISDVSKNRNISPGQLEKSAKGRIWSGKNGKELNLIDEYGSLDDAVDYMKQELQVQNIRIEFYPKLTYRFFEKIVYNNLMESSLTAGTPGTMLSETLKAIGFCTKSSLSTLAPEAFFFSFK